jgi:hypothetical protein
MSAHYAILAAFSAGPISFPNIEPCPWWLAEHLDWSSLMQIFCLERTARCKGRTTVEIQYAISSLSRNQADAASLIDHWRGHWGQRRFATLPSPSCV